MAPRYSRRFVIFTALFIAASVSGQQAAPTIRLTIDYGDGVQKTVAALAWKDKMTVFDALRAAEQHPRGIRVAHTGEGERTFITAIDDCENEGAGAANWRYTVNDQPARYSAGVAELKAGDTILWRFAK
jgi:hypothetical protein